MVRALINILFRSFRENAAPDRHSRRWKVAAVLCLACAIFHLLYAYETFAVTRLSLYDPFGGITLFPRVHAPCTAPSCEAIAPQPITRGEDKVTVILMGYHASRIANYRTVFKRYLAMVTSRHHSSTPSHSFCVVSQVNNTSLFKMMEHTPESSTSNRSRKPYAMSNTVDKVVFVWNNVNKDPPEVRASGGLCHSGPLVSLD